MFVSPCVPVGVWNKVMARVLQGGNLGVLTGSRQRLVVLDVDLPRGGEHLPEDWDLPETLRVRTGNGYHLYFRPDPRVKRIPSSHDVIVRGLDVRAAFGHVVAPPSRHANGADYVFEYPDAPIATLPRKVALDLKTCGVKYFTHPRKLVRNTWKLNGLRLRMGRGRQTG